MATVQLEERLSELKGKPVSEQVKGALSIILESVNGETPQVMDALAGSPASVQLASKIDRESGLMLPIYFKDIVRRRFGEADYTFDVKRQVVDQTYVIVSTDDVAGLKAYLKSNELAPTQVIGVYTVDLEDVVAVLLPCGKERAKSVMSKASMPFSYEDNGVIVDHSGVALVAGYARHIPFADFDSIHADAFGDLMVERELQELRGQIALDLVENRNPDFTKYFELKDKYKK